MFWWKCCQCGREVSYESCGDDCPDCSHSKCDSCVDLSGCPPPRPRYSGRTNPIHTVPEGHHGNWWMDVLIDCSCDCGTCSCTPPPPPPPRPVSKLMTRSKEKEIEPWAQAYI